MFLSRFLSDQKKADPWSEDLKKQIRLIPHFFFGFGPKISGSELEDFQALQIRLDQDPQHCSVLRQNVQYKRVKYANSENKQYTSHISTSYIGQSYISTSYISTSYISIKHIIQKH